MWSEVLLRVGALLRPKAVEGELDEELRFHLERQVEKYVLGGFSREATRRAWIEFGGLEQAKVASFAPARRACGLDPVVALRYE